jgi:hypothetical protein
MRVLKFPEGRDNAIFSFFFLFKKKKKKRSLVL